MSCTLCLYRAARHAGPSICRSLRSTYYIAVIRIINVFHRRLLLMCFPTTNLLGNWSMLELGLTRSEMWNILYQFVGRLWALAFIVNPSELTFVSVLKNIVFGWSTDQNQCPHHLHRCLGCLGCTSQSVQCEANGSLCSRLLAHFLPSVSSPVYPTQCILPFSSTAGKRLEHICTVEHEHIRTHFVWTWSILDFAASKYCTLTLVQWVLHKTYYSSMHCVTLTDTLEHFWAGCQTHTSGAAVPHRALSNALYWRG